VAIVAVERADVGDLLGLAEGVPVPESLLKELRRMGALLCSEGRLTRRVRVEREGRVSRPRMYCFVRDELPRARMTAAGYMARAAPPVAEKRGSRVHVFFA
jgi:hypothetical protein